MSKEIKIEFYNAYVVFENTEFNISFYKSTHSVYKNNRTTEKLGAELLKTQLCQVGELK